MVFALNVEVEEHHKYNIHYTMSLALFIAWQSAVGHSKVLQP